MQQAQAVCRGLVYNNHIVRMNFYSTGKGSFGDPVEIIRPLSNGDDVMGRADREGGGEFIFHGLSSD